MTEYITVAADDRRRGPQRRDQAARPRGLRRHARRRPARRRDPRRAGAARRPRRHHRASSTTSSTEMTLDGGAVPATLGYRGYTKSCCISINHVVCHGIPGDKTLKDGDIVNIDVTPIARRLARRHQPHVPGRRRAAEGAAAGRRHLRMPDARHRAGAGPATASATSATPSRAMPRRTATASSAISAATASAACSTTRPKWSTPAAPAPAPSCSPACSSPIEPMINIGKRRREAARRRLDRGHPRPLAVGAVRAFDRHHRGRLRDLHQEPARAWTSRPTPEPVPASGRRPTSVAFVAIWSTAADNAGRPAIGRL